MPPELMQMLMQMFMGGGMGGGMTAGMGGGGGGQNAYSAAGSGMSGSLLGAGLSTYGAILNKREEKKQRELMERKIRNASRDTQSIMGRYFGQADTAARKATGQEVAGYDTARKEASRLGRSGKQAALDREKQLSGALTQSLNDRGLGSLTTGGNLQRGISADTLRQMSGIDEGLAGLFGQLALGRSGVQAQGTRTLSDLQGRQAQMNTDLAQMRRLGGATLGNFFAPQSSGQSAMSMALPGIAANLGAMGGGMAGMGGGQQGGMSPDLLKWLFSGQPGGYNPSAGSGMNLNTFSGY
jgi:hypothetical protein